MNRIYIYVMLFCGILFLNSMTCFAANEKLSASSRQTLDQLIRTDNRLEKLSRQDKDLRLLVQCDEHTTKNDLLECGVLSYVSLGNGFYTICIAPSELSRFLDSDFVKRAELPRKASLSLDEARTETNVVLVQNGESLSSPYTGKNVVLGFVDSGFDVTHPAFRSSDNETLRIARFWNQIDNKLLSDKENILAEGTDNEEQTHGTHVAGIAGGGYFGTIATSESTTLDKNPYYGVAYDADLVMVGSTLEDTDILNGIKAANTFEVWGESDGFTVTVSLTDSQGETVWSCTSNGTDQSFSVPADFNYSEGGEIAYYTELWNNTRRMYRVALNNLNLKGYDIQIGVTGETQHIDLWTDKNSGQFTDNGKSTHVNFDADRTLGELGGTGKRTISVGNYTTRNVWTNFSGKKQSMLIDYPLNKINYTSSRGPASDGRVKPDVTAPGGMIFSSVSSYSDYYKESSANTVARATINGKSYYWGQMTGTSQASPFVAGVIATWLEANPELSPEDIQLILKKTARQDSHTGACPNSIYGYGKIDALAGIKEVLSPSAIDNLSTDKLYKLYRDGILFTSQAGKINLILSTPDGIIRYSDKTDVEPGTRIEWRELGLNTGLYILHINGFSEKIFVP